MKTIEQLWQTAFPQRELQLPFDVDQFKQLLHCALSSDVLDYKELQDLLAQYPADDLKTLLNQAVAGRSYLSHAAEYYIKYPSYTATDLIMIAIKLLLLLKHGADFSQDVLDSVIADGTEQHCLCLLVVLLSIQLQFPFHRSALCLAGKKGEQHGGFIIRLTGVNMSDLASYLRYGRPLIDSVYPRILKYLTITKDSQADRRCINFSFADCQELKVILCELQQHWSQLMSVQEQRFIEDFAAVKRQLVDIDTAEVHKFFVILGTRPLDALPEAKVKEIRNYFPHIYNALLPLFEYPTFLQHQREVYQWFSEKFLGVLAQKFNVTCQSYAGLTDLIADFMPHIVADMHIKSLNSFVTFPIKREPLHVFLFIQACIHLQFQKYFEDHHCRLQFDAELALRELLRCQELYSEDDIVTLYLALLNIKLLIIQADHSPALHDAIVDFTQRLDDLSLQHRDKGQNFKIMNLFCFHLNGFQYQLMFYVNQHVPGLRQLTIELCTKVVEKLFFYTKEKNIRSFTTANTSSVLRKTAKDMIRIYNQTISDLNRTITQQKRKEHQQHLERHEQIKAQKAEAKTQRSAERKQEHEAKRCEEVALLEVEKKHEDDVSADPQQVDSATKKDVEKPKVELFSCKDMLSALQDPPSIADGKQRISLQEQQQQKIKKREAYLKKQKAATVAVINVDDADEAQAKPRYPVGGTTMHRRFFVEISDDAKKHCTEEQITGIRRFLEKGPILRSHGHGVKHMIRDERIRKGLPDNVTHKLKFMLHGQQVRIYCSEVVTAEGVLLEVCHSAKFGKKVHRI